MVTKLLTILILIITELSVAAQNSLMVLITNQPNNEIILGSIKGDKFFPIDTIEVYNGLVQIKLPENSFTGVYRLILGQTTYAKVMNEPPQQLDFIYNNENIKLKTDFNHPEDSLKVLQSKENEVWSNFIKKEKALQEELELKRKELDYYRSKGVGVSNSDNAVKNRITLFNQLQKKRTELIEKTIQQHPNLCATKLIKMYREPILDGNLNRQQRDEHFKSTYLDNLDFNDESLMNSSVYTQKVFKYLMSYAQRGLTKEQQENEFMKAIDIIVAHTNQNKKVYEFILDYLVSGFEKLRLDNLITYIANKYSGTTCQSDEVSTLERKLLQQKMKTGTVVPDFTLNDINGDPVTLSAVLKEKNLILFWASWCPHCNEMIPQIRNWLKSSDIKNIEIIAISLDDVEKEWKDKVYEMGIEGWFNLSDLKKWDGEVVLEYNVYATPIMFVVDKEQKIIGKPLTSIELKSMLQK